MIKYIVDIDEVGFRLDASIVARLSVLSRASVQKLCKQKLVKVNGEIPKISYRLRLGDEVVVDYDVDAVQIIPEIDLPILYEDDDCVVINKPVGLLTHSKGAFNPEATVATWLEPKLTQDLPASQKEEHHSRSGIVHRLDRATSGVMICAKNPEALSWLQKQFSERRTKKTYVAIIQGVMEPEKAVIDMPIERNPKKPQTFRVGPNGKPSITAYEVMQVSNEHTMLKLSPTTGRTHQLRVHLNFLKKPIVGDLMYEGQSADRLFLHALSLEITLPNRKRRVFKAPLPDEFKTFMND
ncbi:MAG: RluA family pseudouridine synthase [Candidatus Saccharibacteria bacterium]|nr:RluA family pseudouridine synthase [Candidatus Saccharibacteria bacterium]